MYELKTPGSKKCSKKLKIRKKINIPSLLSYQDLLKFMNSTDIGTIHDVNLDFCTDLDDNEKVEGKYRKLGDILLNIAKLYFKLEEVGTVTLNWYNNPTVFRVAIGADGAPFGKDDKATAFLLSFLNLEGRVASCDDNCHIFGANCGEAHQAAIRYCRKLVAYIAYIESQTFSIPGHNNVKFEFEPILGKLIDKAYVDTLYNTNNACQQWNSSFWEYVVQLTLHITSEYKTVEDLPDGTPFKTYLNGIKTKVKAHRVYRKLKSWYARGGKEDNYSKYRFTGKESKLFSRSRNFMHLVSHIFYSCPNFKPFRKNQATCFPLQRDSASRNILTHGKNSCGINLCRSAQEKMQEIFQW